MENLQGLLRVRVIRGVNLSIRDVRSSDPYVVVQLGGQKVKTNVVENNVNPQWHEDLTLGVHDSNIPLKIRVLDEDIFSDDKMGEAEIDLKPLLEAVKMHQKEHTIDTTLLELMPTQENCLSEKSDIRLKDGKVVQDLCIRLRNVESGEVELQLQWIPLPTASSC